MQAINAITNNETLINKPDPDADYQEDDEFELPEDSYDEE